MDRFLELGRIFNGEDLANDLPELSVTDEEILKAHNDRVLRNAGLSLDDGDDEVTDDVRDEPGAGGESNDHLEEDDDDDWLK